MTTQPSDWAVERTPAMKVLLLLIAGDFVDPAKVEQAWAIVNEFDSGARELDASGPDVKSPEYEAGFKAGMAFQREQFTPRAAEAGDWLPIESAPEGQLVVVCWRDEEDTEHPDRYEFDYLEDGVWQKHSDDYEHFCAVAPAGSRGPSEKAPYVGWRPLPPAMHAPGGAGGGE